MNSEVPLDFNTITNWPVAYHGTACEKLPSILNSGLRKPGELPWLETAHGTAGAAATGAVYVSPSLWYASHPVYSSLKRVGTERWVQIVLKLRIRPNTYRIQGNTLLEEHWHRNTRFDPNLQNNDEFEWLLEGNTFQRNDAVIVAVMVRELRSEAESDTCGYCPSLGNGVSPPEFVWTSCLQDCLRTAGFIC